MKTQLTGPGFKTGEATRDDGFKHAVPIYQLLAIHQRFERWELRDTLTFFQAWTIRFNDDFKLGLEDLALRVDKLPKRVLGTHRRGHNGFGLLNEVTLSIEHVHRDELWDVLGSLLHELLHVWQSENGTPGRRKNEHNAEFRNKARECGLIVNEKGQQTYSAHSPFMAILKAFKVTVPDFTGESIKPNRAERDGKSKLALWVCSCNPPQKVRVGRKELFARCTVCKELFHIDSQAEVKSRDLANVTKEMP